MHITPRRRASSRSAPRPRRPEPADRDLASRRSWHRRLLQRDADAAALRCSRRGRQRAHWSQPARGAASVDRLLLARVRRRQVGRGAPRLPAPRRGGRRLPHRRRCGRVRGRLRRAGEPTDDDAGGAPEGSARRACGPAASDPGGRAVQRPARHDGAAPDGLHGLCAGPTVAAAGPVDAAPARAQHGAAAPNFGGVAHRQRSALGRAGCALFRSLWLAPLPLPPGVRSASPSPMPPRPPPAPSPDAAQAHPTGTFARPRSGPGAATAASSAAKAPVGGVGRRVSAAEVSAAEAERRRGGDGSRPRAVPRLDPSRGAAWGRHARRRRRPAATARTTARISTAALWTAALWTAA